ncbi:hypothetical protein C8R45DRAFT_1216376 [Mycena sanguinolenta]|nr:hypothetical protein C8R45DRAFT_1216376 [Mycena sanguinolenta]
MVKIYIVDRTEIAQVWVQYDVDLLDSVRSLKNDIHENEALFTGRQRLQYEGTELQDEQTLQSYSLHEGCIVDIFRNYIVVNIGQRECPCVVDLDEPLSDLRDTVARDYHLDLTEHFSSVMFKEEVLGWDEKRTLSSLGINHHDSVTHIGTYVEEEELSCAGLFPIQAGISVQEEDESDDLAKEEAHETCPTCDEPQEVSCAETQVALPPCTNQKVLHDWDGDMKVCVILALHETSDIYSILML